MGPCSLVQLYPFTVLENRLALQSNMVLRTNSLIADGNTHSLTRFQPRDPQTYADEPDSSDRFFLAEFIERAIKTLNDKEEDSRWMIVFGGEDNILALDMIGLKKQE